MHLLRSMWRAFRNRLFPVTSVPACLQEMLCIKHMLNVMPMRFFSSAIAPSHFFSCNNKEMTKDDVSISRWATVWIWTFVLISALIAPLNAGAVVINNTVSVNSNAGLLNASVDVNSIFNTASSIEFLQYAPGPVAGSSPVSVPATSYSTTGLAAGPFAPSAVLTDVNGAPIAMPGTVDLLPATAPTA